MATAKRVHDSIASDFASVIPMMEFDFVCSCCELGRHRSSAGGADGFIQALNVATDSEESIRGKLKVGNEKSLEAGPWVLVRG